MAFSQLALCATMAAMLDSAGTHSEVEGVCMLAKFLQKPLLQPTVGFSLLGHRREGLKKTGGEKTSPIVSLYLFIINPAVIPPALLLCLLSPGRWRCTDPS